MTNDVVTKRSYTINKNLKLSESVRVILQRTFKRFSMNC